MSKTLQFHSEESFSLGPKVTIISWYVLCVAAALWLTFFSTTS